MKISTLEYNEARSVHELAKGIGLERIVSKHKGVFQPEAHDSMWFGPIDYQYKTVTRKAREMPDKLKQLAETVAKQLGIPNEFNSCMVNHYATAEDHIS
jgi:hypothetical protein